MQNGQYRMRLFLLRPVMLLIRPHETIPVAIVVGGTPKLFTIPPSATGNEATLKDMIIWPNAMAIIGTHDSLASTRISTASDIVVIAMSPD